MASPTVAAADASSPGAAGSHARACHQCRVSKRRCGRELPRCTRCYRLGKTCDYGTPPASRDDASTAAKPPDYSSIDALLERTAKWRQKPNRPPREMSFGLVLCTGGDGDGDGDGGGGGGVKDDGAGSAADRNEAVGEAKQVDSRLDGAYGRSRAAPGSINGSDETFSPHSDPGFVASDMRGLQAELPMDWTSNGYEEVMKSPSAIMDPSTDVPVSLGETFGYPYSFQAPSDPRPPW